MAGHVVCMYPGPVVPSSSSTEPPPRIPLSLGNALCSSLLQHTAEFVSTWSPIRHGMPPQNVGRAIVGRCVVCSSVGLGGSLDGPA